MLLGKLNLHRKIENQKKYLQMINGIKEFAWFPTELVCGHKVWLGYYYKYYVGGININKELFLFEDSDSEYFGRCSITRDSTLIDITGILGSKMRVIGGELVST